MNNNKGFSLIGVMLTMGAVTALTMTMLSIVNNISLSNNKAEAKASIIGLNRAIADVTANNSTCLAALTKVTQVYNGELTFVFPNDKRIVKDMKSDGYPLLVKSLMLMNLALVTKNADNTTTYYGDLMLNVEATKNVLGPKTFKNQKVTSLFVNVNLDNKIVSCGLIAPVIAAVNNDCQGNDGHGTGTGTDGHGSCNH